MKLTSFFAALLFICVFSFSGANAANSNSAGQVYVKSGLEKQMQGLGPALLAGYQNNYSKTKNHSDRDQKIYHDIEQVIKISFDTQSMRATVINGITKDIPPGDIDEILSWLDSPVGKKITELEEIASSPEGMKGTQDFIYNIKNTPVSQERIRLIKDLNTTMDITGTTVDITLSTQFALSMTTSQAKLKVAKDDIPNLYEGFKKNRPQLEPMIEHQVHGSLLYTYQTLSDEELGKYLAFLKSASGKKYSSVTSSYMLNAIIRGSLQFAWQISQY